MNRATNPARIPESSPPKGRERAASRRALAVRIFGLTDRGRERRSNEDQFLIAELTGVLRMHQSSLPQSTVQFAREQGYLFVVADGVGGHSGGEQASALAVGAIEQHLLKLHALKWLFALGGGAGEPDVLREFRAALCRADAKVCHEAAHHPELKGMGTTLTMAYSLDSDLFVAHVGDSRCYLLRGGRLHQLTHDHTLVQQLVEDGLILPEQAVHHPFRHVITNVVGGSELGVQTELHKAHLRSGDVLLLCTDGLTRMVPDERITQTLQSVFDPECACERLVTLANEAGGEDNVTVIVARYDTPEQAPRNVDPVS